MPGKKVSPHWLLIFVSQIWSKIRILLPKNNKNKIRVVLSSKCMHAGCCFSCVWFFVNLWTVARQAPLSMGFSRQEHWSGLPCPPPGGLPDPGIEPTSVSSPALADRFFTTVPPGKTYGGFRVHLNSVRASLRAQLVKNRLQCGRPGLDPWVGKIPQRREGLPTPGFWPRESHGLYSPWGRKESDTTEHFHFPLSSA